MLSAIIKKISLFFSENHIVSLLRIHHWIKNFLIFAPIFFSRQVSDLLLLSKIILTFTAFSLIASSVYIFNDLKDINEDRNHPIKKNRPIPSGKISYKQAYYFIVALAVLGFSTSLTVSVNFFYVLLCYFCLNILYSIKLKHISILDLCIVSVGFVLRVIAGSIVANVKASMWIIIITFLLSFFLALSKRRDDLILTLNGDKNIRKNISGYNLAFIDASMVIMASIVILSYILYTVSPDINARYGNSNLYLSSFFVLIGIIRYMQITLVENKSGSPTNILIRDKFIQFSIIGWVLSLTILIY
jgi:4-hydroxybenzoate polyprenyltransferase